ncbi:RacP protein [Streptomyces sp. MNU89]|uniref:RacP protein n=1 Tax=Streptomyces sp. MNU89 TaxID=2560025 RepID=UPI001E644AB4|nr:RacP protein [Streptomyces sp. MNU89]MCC9738342.1 RacP protein [Streptomyces sp. MNU89]
MARSRARGDAARAHARCICRILLEARPAGLLFPQLLAACELTPAQAWSGIAMLKDTIVDNGWPPLVVTRRDGYLFTAAPDELESYEVAKIREKLTEVRRLITATVAPHAALAPDDKRVRHIVTQLNSVESTLDLIA